MRQSIDFKNMDLLKKNKFLIMFLAIMVLMIILAYWISQMLIGHINDHMPGFGLLEYFMDNRNENAETVSHFEKLTHLFITKSL